MVELPLSVRANCFILGYQQKGADTAIVLSFFVATAMFSEILNNIWQEQEFYWAQNIKLQPIILKNKDSTT